MNTINYDKIIDLYLDGALSPVEEREFRNLLEIDPDLRRLLDAELAVRETFEHDAETIPDETERSYARFMAALAATSPAAGGSDGGGTVATSGGSSSGGWLSAGFMKFAGAAVVTLGLATGGYFAFGDRDASEPAARQSAPVTAPAGMNGTVSAPGTIDVPTVTTEAIPTATKPAEGTSAAASTNAEASRVKGATAKPETKALVDPHDDLTEIDQRSSTEELPIIEDDEIQAKVKLKKNGR